MDRNPDLQIRSAIHHSPVHSQEVFPITKNPIHQLLTSVGVFTSASGITFYQAGRLGERYEKVSFVAESQHNLVHSDIVTEKGSVFEARRQFEGREFLASTDSWFRPVNFYIGPDGALYVIDYYRQFIEHPEWMDEQTMEQYDIYAGRDRGRIYRITPRGESGAEWLNRLNLSAATATELVQTLEHENIWWRRHAQRLLVDRQDPGAVEPLEELVLNSESALARLHALWTLDGLDALEAGLIRAGLEDEEAGVRENAIKLAELYADQDPSLVADLQQLEKDPSERVRYQLLLTLGEFDNPRIQQMRQRMLFAHIEDRWFQIAALSAPSARGMNMLEESIGELASRPSEGRRAYF
ncbi:MAG: dehydrogenase, partial [Candidatus Paceibacterota bacterium]